MSLRKDELLAKKARLAELKRQRELRQEQFSSSRKSVGGDITSSPGKTAEERRTEIDTLVSSLIDRQRDKTGSPSRRESRPSSIYGTGQTTPQHGTEETVRPQMQSASTQTLSLKVPSTVFESSPAPKSTNTGREYITYTKAVQTDPYEDLPPNQRGESDDELPVRARRRMSRREQDKDEEIRARLRKEIEDELRATTNGESTIPTQPPAQQRFPLRTLTSTELNAVTGSSEFLSFVERSSKVIERALDEEYDLLADYTLASTLNEDDEDTSYSRTSKRGQSLREALQLFSDRHTRRRMVSDVQFSPHFNELLLTSYTKNPSAPNEPAGLVLLWNTHASSRPEYTLTAGTDVLSARFSPFHPNIIMGGCYSGQICLWDTRISGRTGAPVQRTPQSGSHLGHTHPVYNITFVGTPNAHNILTASMDGVVCSWSMDMLSQAQEYLILSTPPPAKTEDLAPTSMSFPASDPTFFLVGTEEGNIYPCHRYDRAGAKAGVDNRIVYRGHTAPVMSTHFHPSRGPVDLSDVLLSSSSDWSLKLWKTKPAASSSTAAAVAAASSNASRAGGGMATTTTTSSSSGMGNSEIVAPILDIAREDLIYDAKWAPNKPSVFACVTGAGELEVFDLAYDVEVPVAQASPTRGKNGLIPFRGLNKCAWEERRGSHIAVGGLDGVVTVFDVGKRLQCGAGEASPDEWMAMKRLVAKLQGKT